MICRLCTFPYCKQPAVPNHQLCQKHLEERQKKHKEYLEKKEAFKNASRRNDSLYNTSRWKKLRRFHLDKFPTCINCGTSGSSENPLTVDHILPAEGNADLFFNPDNLQTLCRNCHRYKTAQEIKNRKINRNDR